MRFFIAAVAATAVFGQSAPHPTGPRLTPPTFQSASPLGIARGTTAELTVEGLNLAGASEIYFSEAGVKGRVLRVKELPDLPDIRLGSNGTPSTIDVGPLPPRNQVTVEVEVAPETPVGPVRFRLLTPLGTTAPGAFVVEPYFGEAPDREPNDGLDGAFESFLPAVLVGAISKPGDTDHFKIRVEAGQQIVFYNQGPLLGSTLQPVVTLVREDLSTEAEFSTRRPFAHKFAKAGTYYVRVADFESSGRASNFYRILTGELPVVTGAFPLGLQAGSTANLSLAGFHLDGAQAAVTGKAGSRPGLVTLRPETPAGAAFNEVELALGDDPEVASAAGASLAAAQPVKLPVTINGRLSGSEHWFRFEARKGQKLVLETNARRLESPLDTFFEVLDTAGKPIEQAVARATWETSIVLRDHDSASRGIRIQAYNVLNVGDYVMAGSEILRVDEVPDGPDEDMVVESFGGQRIAWFGTSSEAHGIDQSLYKIHIHPPGAKFSPNGLPLVRLHYQNDDGGPGYGKDSYLEFTAPADGAYHVRLRDIGAQTAGAYRLSIRDPRPGFELSVSPSNPNVPRGGTIPVTVTAMRREGYHGPIQVELTGLPASLTASRNVIPAGQVSCTILINASPDANLTAVPFEAIGHATIGGREFARRADPTNRLKLIALAPKPDVVLQSATKVVELMPGETKEVLVKVKRQNGFAGRIPIDVRDLPARVRVTDSGLNGVMVTEDESERAFTLWALPNAEPGESYVYLSGRVETRSPQQNSYAAPEPVLVRVKPVPAVAAAR